MSDDLPPELVEALRPLMVVLTELLHQMTTNADVRQQLAWLMWCYAEGYRTSEDRELMENWMGEHQDNAEDEATRQTLLAMADEVLAALDAERGRTQ